MARELCIEKLNSIIDEKELCEKIENSIYNYALLQAEIKGIELDIENKYFKRIYVNKLITLYNNTALYVTSPKYILYERLNT